MKKTRAQSVQSLTETLREIVRAELPLDATGHDYLHADRVLQTARLIQSVEGGDLQVIECSALLHDIADHKFHKGDSARGPARAREILQSLGVHPETIDTICTIIDCVSYRGVGDNTCPETLEGKIVQDADRLDALGAIGIARTFAYGGLKSQPMHDPELEPTMHKDFEAYKKTRTSTINHFYEKLLLLRDRMNTASGMVMAENRHKVIAGFLKEFLAEWDGKDFPPAEKLRKSGALYYVYILEMKNGNLYTGYTNDPERRLKEHQKGLAKYTRAFKVDKMVGLWKVRGRKDAMNTESFIKKQPRKTKDSYLEQPETLGPLIAKAWNKKVDITPINHFF